MNPSYSPSSVNEPKAREYVYLCSNVQNLLLWYHGKRGIADVTKLRILKRKDFSGLSRIRVREI